MSISPEALEGAGIALESQLAEYLAALYLNVGAEDRPAILDAARRRLPLSERSLFAVALAPLDPVQAFLFQRDCDPDDTATILRALAPHLGQLRPEHIAGMLDMVRRLASPVSRVRTLAALAVGLRPLARSAAERRTLGPAIADAWRDAVESLAHAPAARRRELIELLAEAPSVHFTTLLASARALGPGEGRAEALCALAQHVPDGAGVIGLDLMQEAYQSYVAFAENLAAVDATGLI